MYSANVFPNSTLQLSSSKETDEASVEIISVTPGPDSDCKDDPSVVVLSDSEAEQPIAKKKMKITDYLVPAKSGTLPFSRIGPKKKASRDAPSIVSTDGVQVNTPTSSTITPAEVQPTVEKSKKKSSYTTYTLGQKLTVLDYVKINGESSASRHFGIPRTTIRGWKGMECLPVNRPTESKGKHSRQGAG